MRLIPVVVLFTACSGSGGPTTFDDNGGTLAVTGCPSSVTTKLGAEAPKLSSSTFGKDPTPQFVHLGFVGDPKTSMVAQWRTVDETTTSGFVRYAAGDGLTADQLTEQAKDIEFGYRGTGMAIYRMHQGHMCDLQPGTTVLGDSRDSAQIWGQLAGELQTQAVDMMLFSGDAVLVGLDQGEWDAWLGSATDVLPTTPIVMIDGNHEADAINFYAQFAAPGDQENFGFDYGHAHFTVANDTPEDDSTLTTSTLDAIKADFQASTGARWKLFAHHQPMYSAGSPHMSNLTLRSSWGPVVDQYAIDLVINGHEHQYEISKPLNNGVVQATNATGTVYVVSGGAGASLYPIGSDFWTQYAEMTYTAAVLHVRRDQMTLDSFRQDGSALTPGFSKTKP
jgi:hypothetical protein